MGTKTMRKAFSIIEVLVSVVIISTSIVYVLKIHANNSEQIVYISERNKQALQDSLYLSPEVLKYHKDRKDAYTILHPHFKLKEDKSKEILKKSERDIFIPEPIQIIPPEEGYGVSATVDEVMLKDKHSSIYHRIKIDF